VNTPAPTPRRRSLARRLALAASLALLVTACGPPPAAAPPPAARQREDLPTWARHAFTITAVGTGAFSPWEEVRYELRWVGERPMIVHRRVYRRGYGEEERAALLTEADYVALMDGLARCQLPALAGAQAGAITPTDASRGWTWTLRWTTGPHKETQQTQVVRPELQTDRRWDQCLEALRQVVDAKTEPIAFEWVFVAEEELGYADLSTVPTARVYIDGLEYPEPTPLWHVPLAAGPHEVRFVVDDEGLDQRYELFIEVGVTTHLELELR